MTRDSNIPLFLWIATALLAHLVWGGGASKLSRAFEETLDIKRFAASVQRQIRGAGEVEIALVDESANESTPPEESKSQSSSKEAEDPADPTEDPSEKDESTAKREEAKKEDPTPPEVTDPKPEAPKVEVEKKEAKKEEAKPEEPKDLPKAQVQKRVAVVQHVEDKDQKDNPNAAHIADQANRVKKETQARITSTDQNDPKPTPGGAHASAHKNPGNSEESRVAQSEDQAGDNRAPTSPDEEGKPEKTAAAQAPPPSPGTEAKTPSSDKGSEASKRAGKDPAQAGQKARAAKEEVDPAPGTTDSAQGSWSVAEARAAQAAQKARRAKKKRLPPMKGAGGASSMLGLGALGTTSSGVNLNLSPRQALAAVGRDRLIKEKHRDSERRKSAHRGSWKSLGIERWRASIENYVASVKPGNQTALNTARVPFASFLNAVYNRLHPIFADSFLASLDTLPGTHPMNRADMKTHLEIVLDKDEGKVVRMGVTHTSGVTAFDIAALESVMRASPFGAPPREIVSGDGKVYFHWEFYRNPFYACSTYFAHPFILKGAPKSTPPSIEPAPWRPGDPQETSPADQRHGWFNWTPALEKRASLR